jgi:hypothetical protein
MIKNLSVDRTGTVVIGHMPAEVAARSWLLDGPDNKTVVLQIS